MTQLLRPLLVLGVLLVVAASAGCQDYRWQWSFNSPQDLTKLEDRAREQGRMVFIFYKFYLDSDSNRMHSDVLADSKVGPLFKDTVNVIVDKASGPDYERHMTKYGVTAPPACVLIAPDGRYKVLTGYIAKDQFIELIRAAQSELSQPAPNPPRNRPKA